MALFMGDAFSLFVLSPSRSRSLARSLLSPFSLSLSLTLATASWVRSKALKSVFFAARAEKSRLGPKKSVIHFCSLWHLSAKLAKINFPITSCRLPNDVYSAYNLNFIKLETEKSPFLPLNIALRFSNIARQ